MDDPKKNGHLVDLLISMIHYWMSEPALNTDVFIIQTVIEMLDNLVYSHKFWQKFK